MLASQCTRGDWVFATFPQWKAVEKELGTKSQVSLDCRCLFVNPLCHCEVDKWKPPQESNREGHKSKTQLYSSTGSARTGRPLHCSRAGCANGAVHFTRLESIECYRKGAEGKEENTDFEEMLSFLCSLQCIP
jgi:hypothetical protein